MVRPLYLKQYGEEIEDDVNLYIYIYIYIYNIIKTVRYMWKE